jgi:Ca2+-binding EF-hand superfamily protein
MKITTLFALLLLLSSTPLLAAEQQIDKNPFNFIDTNLDGLISLNEYLGAKIVINKDKVIELFPKMKSPDKMSERELHSNVFDEMDTNHDGLLSRDEWNSVAPNIVEFRF